MSIHRLFSRLERHAISVAVVLACAAAILPGGAALAAGVVSGVSGTIDQRQVITITGSGFGPAPVGVVFDDFEGGTVGQPIMTGAGSALVGQWNSTTGLVYYSDDYSISGSLAFEADMKDGWLNYVRRNFPVGTSEVFACWWVRIPAAIPGEGNPDGLNWKHVWICGHGTRDDDILIAFLGDSANIIVSGNCGTDTTWTGYGMSGHFVKGDWLRMQFYAKGGLTDGNYDLYILHENGTKNDWHKVDAQTWGNDNYLPYQYESIRFNGYGRTTQNSYPRFDDCYSAYGPNCRARVEIGNNPVYGSCTKLAISAPTSWSGTSITATVNVGGLDPAEDWYLFVVDASGVPSAGYKVHERPYHLSVTNGTGDGDYAAGAVVAISADPAPSGKAFGLWVGNTTDVADLHATSTTVTMPSNDVSLTAGYVWVYQLTVNSGTGDGSYTSGTVVDIAAEPAFSGQSFDQWTGDVADVADTLAADTTITMPPAAVEVTATYKAIAIPGDLNGDGFVGQDDLDIVLDQWGCGDPPAATAAPTPAATASSDRTTSISSWTTGAMGRSRRAATVGGSEGSDGRAGGLVSLPPRGRGWCSGQSVWRPGGNPFPGNAASAPSECLCHLAMYCWYAPTRLGTFRHDLARPAGIPKESR